MNASELRTKSVADLKDEQKALLREQFNLRMQRGLGRQIKSHLFKKVKHTIARIETILKERRSDNDRD